MDWTAVSYSVLDVEGNGQQPPDLVELAVVPIVGGVSGKPQNWLVKPKRPIKYYATRIHGLTNDDVKDQPLLAEHEAEIREVLGGTIIVAHNAHVDIGVLKREMPTWVPVDVLDTLKLARRLDPGRRSYQLSKLVEDFHLADGLSEELGPHRATYDALVAAKLFVCLAQGRTLEELTAIMRGEKAEGDEAATIF